MKTNLKRGLMSTAWNNQASGLLSVLIQNSKPGFSNLRVTVYPTKSDHIRVNPSNFLIRSHASDQGVKKSERKMSLISLSCTFLHFFLMSTVKFTLRSGVFLAKRTQETVKFSAVSDRASNSVKASQTKSKQIQPRPSPPIHLPPIPNRDKIKPAQVRFVRT